MSLKQLQAKLGYQFVDVELLEHALTHRSMGKRNNERLEFLGDSIVGFFVADALYRQFPCSTEGDLTRMRANLVNRAALSKLARKLNLSDYLKLGPGELKSGGYDRDSILADAFEAVIAAIYQDSDLMKTLAVLQNLYHDSLGRVEPVDLKDPKTRLQEYMQSKNLPLPVYRLIEQRGPDHALIFSISCLINDEKEYKASASGRRKAEQKAAQKALLDLECDE